MRATRTLGLSPVSLAVALAAATVAAVVVVLPAAPALAAPTAEEKAKARDHYQRGLTHYDLKEYGEALAEFKNAYRLVQDPAFLFNIAQCHRRLGQNVEALDFYRNYLRRFPNAPARAEVERRVQEIERELVAHPPPAATTPPPSATTAAPPPPPPSGGTTSAPSSSAPASASAPPSSGASGSSGAPARALPAATEPPPATGGAGSPNLLVTSPPPSSEPAAADDGDHPIYTRWWFWTLVGAAVAGGVVSGLAYANRGEIGDCRDLPAASCRTVP